MVLNSSTKPYLTSSIDCSDHEHIHLDISSPIPSYGATIFGVYFVPILIIFGVIGNIISLVILRRAAKKISSHFYLWWMAIFDIIALISFIPTFWSVALIRPYYHYIYGNNYAASWVEYGLLGNYVCQLRMYITFTARTCSIYTIVLVTVERFIMVVFPMKRDKLCNLKVAKISIAVMAITCGIINIPWFFTFKAKHKTCFPLGICVGNLLLLINKMVEFIILTLIPCIIIIVCNGCIIYTLRGRLKLGLLVNTKDAKKQERDITVRLLCISFAFFILTIPSLVIVSIQTVQKLENIKLYLKGAEADAFVFSIILFAVNLAVNFVIYCFTGKNFRTAALALVKCNLKDMRKYRSYLVTQTNSEQEDTNITKLNNKDSIFNKDSFQQKRALVDSNV